MCSCKQTEIKVEDSIVPRTANVLNKSSLSEQLIEQEGFKLDFGNTDKGYVGIINDEYDQACLQIIGKNLTANHVIYKRVTPYILPIHEDGEINFRVLKHKEADKYTPLFNRELEVQFETEFEPWLRPNDYVNYDEDSLEVKLARNIYVYSQNDEEFVNSVIEYIADNIEYDHKKVEKVKTMKLSEYRSDPAETL